MTVEDRRDSLKAHAASTRTLEQAKTLWTYMSSFRARQSSDAIVVCCSYDLRVCDYACELIRQGLARRLVLSGKAGNWTRHLWSVPEAHVFRERALDNGLDPHLILIEDRATNFGENIAFVRALIPGARRITFATKPNSVLRVALTIPVQWPHVVASVDSPALSFPHEVSQIIGVLGVIHEMVGDVERILQYPARGFQVPHELPPPVLDAYETLVAEGFRHHPVR
jgi:uncharacterized SAM-binding protein YcdF (DUF218 family)